MSFNELSDAEKVQAEKDADALFVKVEEAIAQFKSADMETDKTVARIGIISMMGGMTRTTTLGAVAYAAVYAPIVGLTKDQLHGLVDAIFDAVEENPQTAKVKIAYAEMNEKAHLQAQVKKAEALGFDSPIGGGAILSPMPKLKQ